MLTPMAIQHDGDHHAAPRHETAMDALGPFYLLSLDIVLAFG